MHKTINGRWGPITFFKKDEYVGKSLWNYGEYNPAETEQLLKLATPGKLCLDIGANVGVMAQALQYSGFECVAFEPQPEVYKVLCKNFSGLSFNVGLGSYIHTAKMPKVYYSDKGNFGGLGIGEASIWGTIDVEVKVLDDYAFQNVGLIKVDVEGFEEQVLVGGTRTILRDKPILYIEDDRVEKSARLRAKIKGLGYTIEDHKPLLYREENFFALKKNVWDKNYASHNLICRPI